MFLKKHNNLCLILNLSNFLSVLLIFLTFITTNFTCNISFCLFIPFFIVVFITSFLVLVYFHSYAFVFFSIASTPYDVICRLFYRFLNVVVFINYYLTLKHPSQYNNNYNVLEFLDQNSIMLSHVDVTKCFLAGANLAHHVAIQVCKEKLWMMDVIWLVSIQLFFKGEKRTNSR